MTYAIEFLTLSHEKLGRQTVQANKAGKEIPESLKYRSLPELTSETLCNQIPASVPENIKFLLLEKLEELACSRLRATVEKDASLAVVPSSLFTFPSLLSYWSESKVTISLDEQSVLNWAKSSTFYTRHLAKYNEEIRAAAYVRMFWLFCKGEHSYTLAQVQKVVDSFTESDLESPIGNLVFQKVKKCLDKLTVKNVTLDDI